MTKAQILEEALQLDLEDRIDLVDSLRSTFEDRELPAWQKDLLDARIAEARAHPDDSVPWREAIAAARQRLGRR